MKWDSWDSPLQDQKNGSPVLWYYIDFIVYNTFLIVSFSYVLLSVKLGWLGRHKTMLMCLKCPQKGLTSPLYLHLLSS